MIIANKTFERITIISNLKTKIMGAIEQGMNQFLGLAGKKVAEWIDNETSPRKAMNELFPEFVSETKPQKITKPKIKKKKKDQNCDTKPFNPATDFDDPLFWMLRDS